MLPAAAAALIRGSTRRAPTAHEDIRWNRPPDRVFLDVARTRLAVHLTGQIRTCLEVLNDQQIWWRANESSNAIGKPGPALRRLEPATTSVISSATGTSCGTRDAEFAERREIPAAELRARLDLAVSEADEGAGRVSTPARLLDETDRTPEPSTFLHVIGMQLVHYATHAGQIVFATKLLKADALDDVWKRTPGH